MEQFWSMVSAYLSGPELMRFVRAGIFLVTGFVLAKVAAKAALGVFSRKVSVHQAMILRRVVFYAVFALFLVSALHELGFTISVLLGAAGILSVAIGFASQTSASNLISGLFLLGERPFSVGDVIKLGSTVGEVLSIDLLSIKLRTFDNLFVRIPNETLIKSELTTLTRFPIRRIDLTVGVAYKEDIPTVRRLLCEIAEKNVLCLEEPKPVFIFLGFGASSIDLQFSVWVKRENFLELKNSIQQEIKATFDANGIEIPFPHVSIYAGSATDPFPVVITGADVKPGP